MFRLTKSTQHDRRNRADHFRKTEKNDRNRLAIMSSTLVIAVALLVMPFTISAQVLYGSVTGNVTDPAGAAIPGAKVQATNVGTNSTKDTTTDANGLYQFTNLQPGVYKITVAAPSFKTIIQE